MKDESEGIARAMRERAVNAISAADVVVLIQDAGDARPPLHLSRRPDLIVVSKSDLHPSPARRDLRFDSTSLISEPCLPISVLTGAGIDEFRQRLDELAFGSRGGETLALNARHMRQVEMACAELEILARGAGPETEELSAAHLRYALDALGEITGMVSPDELLGRVFATFCIGK